LRRGGSIVSSVTSSLVLEELPKGRSEDFQRHFLSTHFYNPPGKMPACEICGQSQTDPAVVDRMAEFLEKRLRRAVIHVRPTAGFAGNRIAFLLFARITELVIQHGVEMMDYLIGPYTGRIMPPLATLDLVGLDIHAAIIRSLQQNVSDAMHDRIVLPGYIEQMIAAGHLGRKSRDKGGFYKRLESGKHVYVDPATLGYVSAFEPHVQFVEQAKECIHIGMYPKAFEVILSAKGDEADIVREILATYIAYAYMLIGEVTEEKYGIDGIDRVMTTGYNWAGPSMLVQMLGGKERAIELLGSQHLPVPDGLKNDTACQRTVFNVGRFFPAR
jgi:3-hydroxyacyl-CoA dehydrogenase